MPASRRTFTHAARHCSSVPYSCSNSASVSPCMIARIDPIPYSPNSILHRFCGGRKGADWLISGLAKGIARCLTESLDNGLFRIGQLDTVSAPILPVTLQFRFNLLVPGALVLPLPFSKVRIGEDLIRRPHPPDAVSHGSKFV